MKSGQAIWLLAVTALFSCWSTNQAYGQLAVELHDGNINVTTTVVTLHDLAVVTSKKGVVPNAVLDMDIDSFDEFENELTITREQVRIRLMLAGYDKSNIMVHGPKVLRVKRTKKVNQREMIERSIHQQLANQFSIPANDLYIKLDATFKDPTNQHLDFSSLHVDPITQAEVPLGRYTISATVQTRSGDAQSLGIPIQIALYRMLAVAKEDIPRGQKITAEHIDTVRRPVGTQSVDYLTASTAIGKQAQRDIKKYSLIKSGSVQIALNKKLPLIKRNSLVNAIVRRGPLTITMTDVKTLSDGFDGDRIQLLNPQTNRPMMARVIDAQTVEIR